MESLQERAVRELIARQLLLVTAESCSGGLLAKRITDVSGASAMFHAGFVTYSNEMKTALLGVPADLLDAHGAVSEAVARSMAEGARNRFVHDSGHNPQSVLGVALTGIAGPGGGTPEKPVGLVYMALAGCAGTIARVVRPGNDTHNRDWHRENAVDTALKMITEYVID